VRCGARGAGREALWDLLEEGAALRGVRDGVKVDCPLRRDGGGLKGDGCTLALLDWDLRKEEEEEDEE